MLRRTVSLLSLFVIVAIGGVTAGCSRDASRSELENLRAENEGFRKKQHDHEKRVAAPKKESDSGTELADSEAPYLIALKNPDMKRCPSFLKNWQLIGGKHYPTEDRQNFIWQVKSKLPPPKPKTKPIQPQSLQPPVIIVPSQAPRVDLDDHRPPYGLYLPQACTFRDKDGSLLSFDGRTVFEMFWSLDDRDRQVGYLELVVPNDFVEKIARCIWQPERNTAGKPEPPGFNATYKRIGELEAERSRCQNSIRVAEATIREHDAENRDSIARGIYILIPNDHCYAHIAKCQGRIAEIDAELARLKQTK